MNITSSLNFAVALALVACCSCAPKSATKSTASPTYFGLLTRTIPRNYTKAISKQKQFKVQSSVDSTRSTLKQQKRTKFFDKLFKNYDKRLFPSNRVIVEAALFLNSCDSISEISFDYDLGIFLRLKWTDPRLRFDPNDVDGEDSLNIDALMYEQLWVPDLYVANEKRAHFHDVVTPNRLIKLDKNGTLLYSSRLYLTLNCQMELHAFPFDSQFCNFQMHSYAYPENRLQLLWAKTPLEMTANLLIAQFTINSIEFEDTLAETPRGNYSSLIVTFHFARDIGFYIIQIYVPSFLTVLTSFTAFWIDPLAVPGRVTIGVFTTLIMANMSFSFRETLPTVSYIKAIDIWILACTLFVFTALVEYALVNVLLRQKPKQHRHSVTPPTPQSPQTPLSPRIVSSFEGEDNENIATARADPRKGSAAPHPRRREALHSSGDFKVDEMTEQIFNFQKQRQHLAYRILHLFLPHTHGVHFHELTGLERCNFMEALSRRLFLGSFFLFNLFYWVTYLYFLNFVTHDAPQAADHGDKSRHAIVHQ